MIEMMMGKVVLVFALFNGCSVASEDIGSDRSTNSSDVDECSNNKGPELPDLLELCGFENSPLEDAADAQTAGEWVQNQNPAIISCLTNDLGQFNEAVIQRLERDDITDPEEVIENIITVLGVPERCWAPVPVDDYVSDKCWSPLGPAFYFGYLSGLYRVIIDGVSHTFFYTVDLDCTGNEES